MKHILSFLLIFVLSSCSTFTGGSLSEDSLHIHDIQGCDHVSPYKGKVVDNIFGIVTHKVSNGFYLEDTDWDELDCSSEAIFIFTEKYPDVIRGDHLVVTGEVVEFYAGGADEYNLSKTEIINPEIRKLSRDNQFPQTVILGIQGRIPPRFVIEDDGMQIFEPDQDAIDFFESLESMLVEIDGGIVVGPRNTYDEIVVVPYGLYDVGYFSLESALVQTESETFSGKVMIKQDHQYSEKANVGDTLENSLIGIMEYSYGNYKIVPVLAPKIVETNSRKIAGVIESNDFTLASYNVNNLSRFDSEQKFKSLAADIKNDLLSPDIVVLHEVMDDSGIENDGTVNAEKTLSQLLRTIKEIGGPSYTFVDLPPLDGQDGGIPGGNIRSVIMYREDRGINLSETSDFEDQFDNPVRIGENNPVFQGTRKPIVCMFDWAGGSIMVVAVHLTSQTANSPLFGSLQTPAQPESLKRLKQAEFLLSFIADKQQQNNNIPIVLIGDLNDVPWSPTVQFFRDSSLRDLGGDLKSNERYSYILDGNAFQLDYIFITEPNEFIITNFQIVHINSVADYRDRFSDHDPVFVSLKKR